jgi:gamma-glutamyl:cysteine ligase YbdK (ATP-grasp superfamily)
VRRSALELFAESVTLHEPLLPVLGPQDPDEVLRKGGVPELAELRLHHGTVWRWNRAVFDAVDGGHLRIELRALPSGPTVADMVANAAFSLGLVIAFATDIDEMLAGLTFGHARRNFYDAARFGLDARLVWPGRSGPRAGELHARDLVERLLPVAHSGLRTHGVDADEADAWLAIIQARVATGRTGSRWQRTWHAALGGDTADAAMVERYLQEAATGRPVHTWDLP